MILIDEKEEYIIMRYLVRTAPTHPTVAMNRAINRFFNDDFFRPFASAPVSLDKNWNNLALDVAENDDNRLLPLLYLATTLTMLIFQYTMMF